MNNRYKSFKTSLHVTSVLSGAVLATGLTLLAAPAMAQQVGAVNGYVTSPDGTPLSGVAVEAKSPELPSGRVSTTGSNGRYQLSALPPGDYIITYKDSSGRKAERNVRVLLDQKLRINVQMGPSDEVVVVGTKMNLDTGQASLKDSLGEDVINSIPIGQEYRDIQKLIIGAAYSEDGVRGPSVGGSGQDNIYQFDGVDVSLPMFGNLAAEPSSHDIAQVSIVRGGAKAIDFNRSGGAQINTVSKSGTNEFHGEVSYRTEPSSLSADPTTGPISSKTAKHWITVGLSGPIIKDKLFFYGSYYRPTIKVSDRTNNTGTNIIDFNSTRNEYFGKLTFTPTNNILLNGSYRTSDRSGTGESIGPNDLASTAVSGAASQDVINADGSWAIDDTSSLSFKFTDYTLKTSSRPDTLFDLNVSLGDNLPINALDQSGFFRVPVPVQNPATPEEIAYNAFAQSLISQYGPAGTGIGGSSTINNQDFFRTSFQVAYDKTVIAGDFTHDLHFGYKYEKISEDLNRLSNGFGSISAPGGIGRFGPNVFYVATINQMSLVDPTGSSVVPDVIHSESKLQSIEFNDTIENGPWEFNIGVMVSKDILYGQGLKENSQSVSGFELAPGHKYKMHATKWRNMIQPRFGVKFQMSDNDQLFANFARYNPPANSLARAASWARNLRKTIRIQFDQNGNYIGNSAIRSSSGKLFQEGIKPRFINEYLVGWDHNVNDRLLLRFNARYRKGGNFWEDTNNNARTRFNSDPAVAAPPEIAALGDYIPQLNHYRFDGPFPIGGSSYVIAQLDTAHTDYYEAGVQAEYTGDHFYLNGSYVWSRYRGNFDQDNTTTNNDANTFIGSSFLADGAGRQLWNFRDGKLKGDIPTKIKLFGYYQLPWNGRVGAFAQYQSGQPWETWSYVPYSNLTGSRSDTSRYAEQAGSRRSDSHFQFDMSYTQVFKVFGGREIELRADLYNVFNKQTGYNIDPKFSHQDPLAPSSGYGVPTGPGGTYGKPRSFYRPRRLQLTAKARF